MKEENKETDKHPPVKDQTRKNYILKLTSGEACAHLLLRSHLFHSHSLRMCFMEDRVSEVSEISAMVEDQDNF